MTPLEREHNRGKREFDKGMELFKQGCTYRHCENLYQTNGWVCAEKMAEIKAIYMNEVHKIATVTIQMEVENY